MENNSLYFYPRSHLSISALNSFENCPFSFWMSYYMGIKAPEKASLTFGKQFQEVLNAKYRGQDTAPLLEAINPKSRGLASLLLTKATDYDDIISVDEPYEVDLGFGIPVMFVPDLLTKSTIVENKTTTGYYNSEMVGKERQATLYYLGVRKHLGFTPRVVYQIFNTKDRTHELVPTERADKDIDNLLDWMELKLKQIESCYNKGVWDTKTHKFCNFKNVCPLQETYGNQL